MITWDQFHYFMSRLNARPIVKGWLTRSKVENKDIDPKWGKTHMLNQNIIPSIAKWLQIYQTNRNQKNIEGCFPKQANACIWLHKIVSCIKIQFLPSFHGVIDSAICSLQIFPLAWGPQIPFLGPDVRQPNSNQYKFPELETGNYFTIVRKRSKREELAAKVQFYDWQQIHAIVQTTTCTQKSMSMIHVINQQNVKFRDK